MNETIKKISAFTLAETLITLSMLGVIATMTIPSVVNHYKTTEKKTKVKKAINDYDSLLRRMAAENMINSNEALYKYISDNHCANITKYVKVVQRDGCKFQTSEGIWWQVATDNNTLWAKVALTGDKNKLESISSKTTAYKDGVWFFGSFKYEDKSGWKLYINDSSAASAVGDDAPTANTNLQNFIK